MARSASNPKIKKNDAQPATGLPLFFQKPTPLNPERHGKAGVLLGENIGFAAHTNSILINAIEFFEASRQYPIVFTQSDAPLPLAIVGLESSNYFVNDKGEWKTGAYVPAYVRKYPFVFMDVPERNEFMLCIDEAASQFKADGGNGAAPLFEGDKPSALTRSALEFCSDFHNHSIVTSRFCEDLQASGLLVPMQSNVKLASGRELRLAGFQAIDEQKVMALPDAKILEFFKKGWLPLIYTAVMSTSNWTKLVNMTPQ